VLELSGISLSVGGEPYLSEVNARFVPGTFNVLLGPTLAGKTSLLRVMAGLDVPTAGRITVKGVDVTGMPVKKRSVAFVYQQFINYPSLSVFDNIASPLKIAGVGKAETKNQVEKIADLLGISTMLARKPLELSGGQQQRVALARALVREADLVLLDEPLANLDYKLREELRIELPKLFAETGSIVVYATTEPEEALLLGGNITLLHEGRIMQAGPTLDVYRNPQSLQAARTFSDPPLNKASATRTDNQMQFLSLPVPYKDNLILPDGPYNVGFRAHHLHVAKPSSEAIEVNATVAVTEITGSESFIHVDAIGERWTALTHGVHHHTAGDIIKLYLNPADFLLFDDAGNRVEAG
jgi:glycerol transport system ATP-binding protein